MEDYDLSAEEMEALEYEPAPSSYEIDTEDNLPY